MKTIYHRGKESWKRREDRLSREAKDQIQPQEVAANRTLWDVLLVAKAAQTEDN